MLPTDSSSKYSSGLSVSEFMKKISFINLSKKGIETIGPSVITFANYEGLQGHAQSIIKKNKEKINLSKQDLLEYKGKVKTLLKNAMFEVELENGHTMTAHTAGKLSKNRIVFYKATMLLVEMSPYDLTKGRIIFRG